jgi:hypothetical protein
MSLSISIRSEIIKTKRSAAFWLSLVGAAVIPTIFFLGYVIEPQGSYNRGWAIHLMQGWQVFNAFLLPMFVILVCSLIPQIEYKNNAWKQVFASPQTLGNIFFSKYLTILLMVVFLFLVFNILLILAAIVPNLFYSKYTFIDTDIDWSQLGLLNFKTMISLLALISLQYWMSLRFKNFIIPIGIGLGMLIVGLILYQLHWKHVYKIPYAFPAITMESMRDQNFSLRFKNHEWNSVLYSVFFAVMAFLDMRYRKERG